MTVLAAMQSAALRLLGQKPATFFGASGTFENELCDLVNEAARDIASYREWQALVKFATVTGDGTTNEYSLPADYENQLSVSDIQQTGTWFWQFERITDVNRFAWLENSDFAVYPYPGAWIIYGNKLRFTPPPAAGQAATYPYVSNAVALAFDGTPKQAFSADTDSFVLPERLLTLWLVWRWRENKKLDSSGDMEAFTKALEEYASRDAGSRRYRNVSRRSWPGTYPAYPGTLG